MKEKIVKSLTNYLLKQDSNLISDTFKKIVSIPAIDLDNELGITKVPPGNDGAFNLLPAEVIKHEYKEERLPIIGLYRFVINTLDLSHMNDLELENYYKSLIHQINNKVQLNFPNSRFTLKAPTEDILYIRNLEYDVDNSLIELRACIF